MGNLKAYRLSLSAFFIASVLFAVLYCAWPLSRPPFSLVEPRLTRLKEPFTDVQVLHYWDGGSIGVQITDADGFVERFALPIKLRSREKYDQVFVGAIHARKPGAVEVANSMATKQELSYLIARYGKNDPYADSAVAKLSNRPFDWLRVYLHHYRGNYDWK